MRYRPQAEHRRLLRILGEARAESGGPRPRLDFWPPMRAGRLFAASFDADFNQAEAVVRQLYRLRITAIETNARTPKPACREALQMR